MQQHNQPSDDLYDDSAAPGMTQWLNPTTNEVRFEIHLGPDEWHKATNRRRRGRRLYRIPAGEKVWIPSEFDQAIQKTDDSGTIVIAGLAPQLVKVGSEAREVHPSLDTGYQLKKSAEAAALLALEQKRSAEAALAAAGGKIVDAGGTSAGQLATAAELEELKRQLAESKAREDKLASEKAEAEKARKKAEKDAEKSKREAEEALAAATEPAAAPAAATGADESKSTKGAKDGKGA